MKPPEQMTDDELQIAIAKWCGWRAEQNSGTAGGFICMAPNGGGMCEYGGGTPDSAILRNCPDSRVNAMWEAEEQLLQSGDIKERYSYHLYHDCPEPIQPFHATAR